VGTGKGGGKTEGRTMLERFLKRRRGTTTRTGEKRFRRGKKTFM